MSHTFLTLFVLIPAPIHADQSIQLDHSPSLPVNSFCILKQDHGPMHHIATEIKNSLRNGSCRALENPGPGGISPPHTALRGEAGHLSDLMG